MTRKIEVKLQIAGVLIITLVIGIMLLATLALDNLQSGGRIGYETGYEVHSGTLTVIEDTSSKTYEIEESDAKKVYELLSDGKYKSSEKVTRQNDLIYRLDFRDTSDTKGIAVWVNKDFDVYIGNAISVHNDSFTEQMKKLLKKY